jgi:hypothetical protein
MVIRELSRLRLAWDSLILLLIVISRQQGVEILDRKACTARYARRMLPIDLLASLPLDLLAWVLIGNGQVMGGSLVLALRLLRLLRIVRLFVILKRWEAYNWSNPGFLRIVKFLASVLLLMHWLACAWFYTAYAAGFPAASWAARAGITESSVAAQYVRSLRLHDPSNTYFQH